MFYFILALLQLKWCFKDPAPSNAILFVAWVSSHIVLRNETVGAFEVMAEQYASFRESQLSMGINLRCVTISCDQLCCLKTWPLETEIPELQIIVFIHFQVPCGFSMQLTTSAKCASGHQSICGPETTFQTAHLFDDLSWWTGSSLQDQCWHVWPGGCEERLGVDVKFTVEYLQSISKLSDINDACRHELLSQRARHW